MLVQPMRDNGCEMSDSRPGERMSLKAAASDQASVVAGRSPPGGSRPHGQSGGYVTKFTTVALLVIVLTVSGLAVSADMLAKIVPVPLRAPTALPSLVLRRLRKPERVGRVTVCSPFAHARDGLRLLRRCCSRPS